ncbi:MAG: hypothetical protein K940chlam7_00491 [Chlamydiae bacterium]|nr:hypothetical protein [Chlamydiota bacterium]
MSRLATFLLITILCGFVNLHGDDNFCHKCEVLREYHSKNPSKYEFYDDYLKDLEEKGADAVNLSIEDLPPEIQYIMDPEKKVVEKK